MHSGAQSEYSHAMVDAEDGELTMKRPPGRVQPSHNDR
jgi:hypothetical protein